MQLDLTIICDDIRQEIGRKLSFMGIYDEAIVFKRLPARVPKLCMFQRWLGSDLPEYVKIELTGSAVAGTFSAEVRPGASANPDSRRANLLVAFAPVDFVDVGQIELRTYMGNEGQPSHKHLVEIRLDPNLILD